MGIGCMFCINKNTQCVMSPLIVCSGSEDEKKKCPEWKGNYLWDIKEILRLRM
jgi:hypothetical protein